MDQDIEVRFVKLESSSSQILDKLSVMDGKMNGLDTLIRGNGKPGLATIQREHEVKIKALESARKNWRELTILIVSGGVIALFTAFVQHFVR